MVYSPVRSAISRAPRPKPSPGSALALRPPPRRAPVAHRRQDEGSAPPGRNHPDDLCGDRAAHRCRARDHLALVKHSQMDAARLRAAVYPHGAGLARGPPAPAPHARRPPRRARRALCARARGGIRRRCCQAARGARAALDGKAGHGAEHPARPPSRGGASGGGAQAPRARGRGSERRRHRHRPHARTRQLCETLGAVIAQRRIMQ